MRICKVKKVVHQQHVNCLINTWVLPFKTWLLIACVMAFYAIIEVKLHKKKHALD